MKNHKIIENGKILQARNHNETSRLEISGYMHCYSSLFWDFPISCASADYSNLHHFQTSLPPTNFISISNHLYQYQYPDF